MRVSGTLAPRLRFSGGAGTLKRPQDFNPKLTASGKTLIGVAGFCRESRSIAKCDTTLLSKDKHSPNGDLSPATRSPAGTRDATFNPCNATALSASPGRVAPYRVTHTFTGLPSPWETPAQRRAYVVRACPSPLAQHHAPSVPLSSAGALYQRPVYHSPSCHLPSCFPVIQHPHLPRTGALTSRGPPSCSSCLHPATMTFLPFAAGQECSAQDELPAVLQPGPSPSVVSALARAKSCSLHRPQLCL